MKKIISSRSWLAITLCGTLLFGIAFAGSLYFLLQNVITKGNGWLGFLILSSGHLLFLIFSLIALNRLSCTVWYDDVSIGRRGLLFGFKHQIYIHEIKEVIIVSVSKQGRYVVVIDDFGKSFEGISKKSYIRFEYTEKNKDIYQHLCRIKRT